MISPSVAIVLQSLFLVLSSALDFRSSMATPAQTPGPNSTVQELTASCTTAVPGRHGHVPITACNSYYNYDPQFPASVAVAAIFGIFTAAHTAQAIIYKKVGLPAKPFHPLFLTLSISASAG